MSSASEISVNVGGDQNSVTVSSPEGSDISVSGSEGVAITVSPNAGHSVSISQDSGTSITVNPDNSSVVTATNDVVNVSVDSIPAVDKVTNLRELNDVIGDPTSNQVLVYNQSENNFQFADQTGGDGTGDPLTDQFIDVTNGDGAFDHLTDVNKEYEVGTSITQILKDILDPYKTMSLSLTNIRYRYILEGGQIDGVTYNTSYSPTDTVEVGSNIRILGLNYTASDIGGYVPLSSFLTFNGVQNGVYNGVPIPSGVTFVPGFQYYETQQNSPHDLSIAVGARDDGPPGYSGTITVTSTEEKLKWRYKAFLLASTIDLEATPIAGNFESIVGSGLVGYKFVGNSSGTSSNFSMNTPIGSDDENSYTYIMYPMAFGELTEVLEEGAFPVIGDFVKLTGPLADGGFEYAGPNGQDTSYLVYQTDEKQAFGGDVELTFKF